VYIPIAIPVADPEAAAGECDSRGGRSVSVLGRPAGFYIIYDNQYKKIRSGSSGEIALREDIFQVESGFTIFSCTGEKCRPGADVICSRISNIVAGEY